MVLAEGKMKLRKSETVVLRLYWWLQLILSACGIGIGDSLSMTGYGAGDGVNA